MTDDERVAADIAASGTDAADTAGTATTATETVSIEFCGEWFRPEAGTTYAIGREADLSVDTNPYLHRRLLAVDSEHGLWWLANIGQFISVSLATPDGAYQAVLGPGARVPLVFPALVVMFTAGAYTYELTVHTAGARFTVPGGYPLAAGDEHVGTTTIGAVALTATQRLLLVALCEPLLRGGMVGGSQVPTSAAAAERLGWPLTTFNRKLDNVCDKLDREGVQGLRGGVGKLATNRRSRLVEHAVLSRLVTAADLPLLDGVQASQT